MKMLSMTCPVKIRIDRLEVLYSPYQAEFLEDIEFLEFKYYIEKLDDIESLEFLETIELLEHLQVLDTTISSEIKKENPVKLYLKGERSLISGSTASIVLRITTTLAQEDFHVIINGRSQTSVDNMVK